MTGEFVAFFILSLLTIGGAVFMISFTRVVHMVISLGITFISIAGLFVLVGAEFVGVAQVLVYSGAISILMLFGIMLTKHDAYDEGTGRKWKNRFILLFVALVFALLFWGIQNTAWPASPPPAASGVGNAKEIGLVVFTEYVIPFELVSVLLLVALIGAIIMAKKEGDNE
ncbi:NADH-quinone oxidoreductase subunit J [Brevibacillus nitrificans]|uniref:NADH-quinone oxidoreductase subunit J n=1 Tax=Brevibacillus nitrificans TaxID=651560 RepID=UPI0026253B86|nr:NADH-quinone oxidoreductase subunit J [Brevibacillus nitrificans]MED1791161.1 NADH-quinone oxidoreductase subunit J [Brevibacillus nitrificans]